MYRSLAIAIFLYHIIYNNFLYWRKIPSQVNYKQVKLLLEAAGLVNLVNYYIHLIKEVRTVHLFPIKSISITWDFWEIYQDTWIFQHRMAWNKTLKPFISMILNKKTSIGGIKGKTHCLRLTADTTTRKGNRPSYTSAAWNAPRAI